MPITASVNNDDRKAAERELYRAVYVAVLAAHRAKGVDFDAADYAAKQDARSAVARMAER